MPPRKQIHADRSQHKTSDDDQIVSRDQAKHRLKRRADQAPPQRQRVSGQWRHKRIRNEIRVERTNVQIKCRVLHPPQVPVKDVELRRLNLIGRLNLNDTGHRGIDVYDQIIQRDECDTEECDNDHGRGRDRLEAINDHGTISIDPIRM